MVVTEQEKKEAHEFYRASIELLQESGANFMLGGAFALFQYTGIYRDTKDLDVFCKPNEYTQILKHFQERGYETQLYDVRWIAKIFKGAYFIDIIFNSVNNICTVDDSWYENATEGEFVGKKVKFLSAEELFWCKIYVQNRERYDAADINHLILKIGEKLDWKRILFRIDPHWHLLLAQLLSFQFVYPSEFHEKIPRWLFDELIDRAKSQYELPPPFEKVCRGPMIDNTQYEVDVKEWNYKAYTIKTV